MITYNIDSALEELSQYKKNYKLMDKIIKIIDNNRNNINIVYAFNPLGEDKDVGIHICLNNSIILTKNDILLRKLKNDNSEYFYIDVDISISAVKNKTVATFLFNNSIKENISITYDVIEIKDNINSINIDNIKNIAEKYAFDILNMNIPIKDIINSITTNKTLTEQTKETFIQRIENIEFLTFKNFEKIISEDSTKYNRIFAKVLLYFIKNKGLDDAFDIDFFLRN